MVAIDLRASFAAGWRVFAARPLFWIGLEAAIGVLSVVAAVVIALVLGGILALVGWGDVPLTVLLIFGLIGVSLWSVVVSQLALGKVHICLQGIDGPAPRLAGLFAKRHLLWPFIVGYSVFGAAVAAGLLLLVVPGVWLLLRWSFWSWAMVDRDLGVRDALAASARMTEGHRPALLVFGIAAIGGTVALTLLMSELVGILLPSVPEFVREGVAMALGWVWYPVIWLAFTAFYRGLAPAPAPAPALAAPSSSPLR